MIMKRTAKCKNNILHIYFDAKDLEAGRAVKKLSHRRFYRKPMPHWESPLLMDSVDVLIKYGFTLSQNIKEWKDSLYVNKTFDPDFHVPGLSSSLKKYQLEGVQLIDKHNGRVLLADDPGLGKTVETIAWCHYRKKNKILIICPSFAKYNWEDEIKYWLKEDDIQIIQGISETVVTTKWVIANYEILLNKGRNDVRDDLLNIDWDVVLIDECHYISNPHAIRTLTVQALVENVEHVIPISATPGKNRPADLFVSLNIVNSKIFPNFFKFGFKFCGARKKFGHWEFKGATNLTELNQLLTTSMIRRTKNEVFAQLPERIRIPVLLEAGKELESSPVHLKDFEKMKQSAVKAKMPMMIEWIRNMLLTEDKLIIFGEHASTIDAIYDAFKDISVRVDGSISSPEKRKEAVYKFQKCKKCGIKKEFHGRDNASCASYVPDLSVRLFIGSRAAKESGTLTAANHTVFTEFWWNIEDHKQAEDRAFGRAGDLHGTTNWYLIAKGTIEEHIAKIISLKDKRMSLTIDGKGVTKDLLLTSLIGKYKGKTR